MKEIIKITDISEIKKNKQTEKLIKPKVVFWEAQQNNKLLARLIKKKHKEHKLLIRGMKASSLQII